jgi:hypothetical protein
VVAKIIVQSDEMTSFSVVLANQLGVQVRAAFVGTQAGEQAADDEVLAVEVTLTQTDATCK